MLGCVLLLPRQLCLARALVVGGCVSVGGWDGVRLSVHLRCGLGNFGALTSAKSGRQESAVVLLGSLTV